MSNSSSSAINLSQLLARARKHHESGKLSQAENIYRRVLAEDEQNADAWHMLGVLAFQAKNFPLAVEYISRSLELRPDSPEALNNLGSVMLASGNLEQAEKLIRIALKFRPDYADALANLGVVLNATDRQAEAVDCFEKAIHVNPNSAMFHNNLGSSLRDLGRLEEAKQAYERALKLDTSNPGYVAAKGSVLMESGDHEKAMDLFKQAVSSDPWCIPALCGLVRSKKISPDDQEVRFFRQAAARLPSLPSREQIDFLFAWGKLLDDIGNYDDAFQCFSKANALRRVQRPYARAEEENRVDALVQTYTPEFFARLNGSGSDSEAPVFIIGMPRSGTTLTEQIVSSHPLVFGGGELKILGRIVRENFGSESAQDMVQALNKLAGQEIHELASSYLREIRRMAPDEARVTDKMPGNFWHLGLIRLMFPRARVIHVRRNPADTLLSCFQQNFGEGQAFSNDLEDAGHYYGLYRRIMEHWREVLPGFVLDVDYESLVKDPETESRRLIAHVGLEWDDACLEPSGNRRAVRTASQWQVRQPVHTGSVERWQRYEAHLRPLLGALGGVGVDFA